MQAQWGGITDAALAAMDLEQVVREHRMKQWRRQLIADVEDHIGDQHEWPHKEQRVVLHGRAVGRGEIFRFALFLLANHAPPRPVAALLCGLGLLPTAKKRRDAWDVLRSFRDGIDAQQARLSLRSSRTYNRPPMHQPPC